MSRRTRETQICRVRVESKGQDNSDMLDYLRSWTACAPRRLVGASP